MVSGQMSLSRITVRYGKATAVGDATITAPAGSVTAVVGPNGAGKSSLLLAAYGSVPSSGSVQLDGHDIAKMTTIERARLGVALVPQGRQLFPRMTVVENMQVMAEMLHLPRTAVSDALDRFPILRERSRHLAGVLSGGEQQMLVVSRALMGSPKVLLLDEMMTGLAPKIVQSLSETVNSFTNDGVAAILADPSLGRIRGMVDRGYVLLRGSVVAEAQDAAKLDRAYQDAMGVIKSEL